MSLVGSSNQGSIPPSTQPSLSVRQIGASSNEVRGTQSFVHIMSWCWRHPSLVALEILWRWIFGAGALWLIATRSLHIFSVATDGTNNPDTIGLTSLTITDPVAAATKIASAITLLAPLVWNVARWALPLLLALWVVISAFGRTIVLRRADSRLQSHPLTLMLLQLVRVLALAASSTIWFLLMMWAGAVAITGPLARGEQPELVKYCAIVIVGTIGLFVAWSTVSWSVLIAPLLVMLRGYGVGASLVASFRLGPLKMKLVEINLVMGIVKIALMVLALVFSACPLPFESIASQEFLTWWWIGVLLLYIVASDFFHIARLIAYLELWRAYEAS